jgi:predicted phosphodiesterase
MTTWAYPAGPIGLMADSHNDAAAIAAALSLFKKTGCRRVVHLGDVCDSAAPATAAAALAVVMAAAVTTVMGNNEYALLRHPDGALPENAAIWDFMSALPLQIETDGHIFVHNRPFPDRLGVSCLTGDLSPADYGLIDARCHGVMVFRGHGHRPSVCRSDEGFVSGLEPDDGTRVLAPGDNWVVTCGALQQGWCMIWDPAARVLQTCRL